MLGPYFAVTTTLVQRLTPPALLPHVLSRRGVLIDLASLGGVLVGGLLVQVAGATSAVLASALATIALGAVTVLATGGRRSRGVSGAGAG